MFKVCLYPENPDLLLKVGKLKNKGEKYYGIL